MSAGSTSPDPQVVATARERQRRDSPALVAAVDAMRAAGVRPRLVWRCPERCALLSVWRLPSGVDVLFRPRQPKRSEALMRKTLHTERGDAFAVELDVLDLASRSGLLIASLAACAHLEARALLSDVRADLAAGRSARVVDHEVAHLGEVTGPRMAGPQAPDTRD